MPRALWSGSIAFGLVNAPVKMYSAIDEHDLELHLVHAKDGSRIGYAKICKKEKREVPADEIVKAYDVGGGELVYLEDEDFEAAGEDGYRTIEILDFVPRDQIDPIVFERTYYLGPAEGAEKVYSLLLKAMADSGLAAIARYVFHDRQRLGCLRIRDGVITLENMYFADEIRPLRGIAPRPRKVEKRELEMARALIEKFTSTFDHEQYEDEYRQRLLALVRRKHRGEEVHAAPPEQPERTPDLLEALRASVDAARAKTNGKGASRRSDRAGLDGLTVVELRERAAKLEIRGRAAMSKKDLVKAIGSAS